MSGATPPTSLVSEEHTQSVRFRRFIQSFLRHGVYYRAASADDDQEEQSESELQEWEQIEAVQGHEMKLMSRRSTHATHGSFQALCFRLASMLLLLPMLAGCSGSHAAEAERAVHDWFGAAASGDCQNLKRLTLAPVGLDVCDSVKRDKYSNMPTTTKVKINISGHTAEADVNVGSGTGRSILLVEQAGSWLIVYPITTP